jgi:hypothetical protein
VHVPEANGQWSVDEVARTPQLKTTLLDLSKKCEKLAAKLETALALLDENEVVRSDIESPSSRPTGL